MLISNTKIISASISVLFNYMLYAYLDRLEKIGCKCSNKTQRDVTKSSIMLNYIIIFGLLVFDEVPRTTAVVLTIYNVTMAIGTFFYLRNLKKNNCKCSESITREVYYHYYLITFLLELVLITMFLILAMAKVVKD